SDVHAFADGKGAGSSIANRRDRNPLIDKKQAIVIDIAAPVAHDKRLAAGHAKVDAALGELAELRLARAAIDLDRRVFHRVGPTEGAPVLRVVIFRLDRALLEIGKQYERERIAAA